jgi:hypothetical protein
MTLVVSFVRASQVLLGLVLARFRTLLFCPFETFVSIQIFASNGDTFLLGLIGEPWMRLY